MAVERASASVRTPLRTFQNDEQIQDHVDHLILKKANLIERLKRLTWATNHQPSNWNPSVYPNQPGFPSQPGNQTDPVKLREHIQETELTIKSFKAILKVKASCQRVPRQLHTPFYNASQHPEILSNVVPFARRVGLIIQQNKNSPDRLVMDVIDAINIIEALDTYRDFAELMENTDKLPRIAGFLPDMIRKNTDRFPTTSATLLRTLERVQLDGRLERALDQVNTVKRQLDRLPLTVRLLLLEASPDDCGGKLRTDVRRTVLDMVWERSRTSPKTELTAREHLIRACLQVVISFNLTYSTSETYFELLGSILSQPGILDSTFSKEAKTNIIRMHFRQCIYPSLLKDDSSFDAIVAYAEYNQGVNYKSLWMHTWRTAMAITEELDLQAGVDWGYSPFLHARQEC
ncbi:hypothetical protein B0J12DRAFT_686502 [Macrophomina phaseolina]|uniref:Uncharacterized protein n=1 Tax=Macrophomina phaseolina TaxID=35725 RepID=A0ABQ8FT16_9PEZI|nr:hypothetical protein B0J12DRAFT_686502 [Macrophomina phaseolina]